jgi:hypothetical protein
MSSTYSDLKIELITTGEQSGTWGDTTNTNLGTAIEEAITGSADVTFASGTVTLTLTDTNSTQTARNLRLNLTGTSGGAQNLIVPAIQKQYIVYNGCADTITIKNSTGTGVAVPAGKSMIVFNNGTNVTEVSTYITSPAFGTTLSVAQGGTGATTFSSGAILKGAGASAITTATAGTDYVAPGTATTFTAKQTFATTTKVQQTLEKMTISATAATGTINYDALTQSALYYTTNASGNFTVNFRGDVSTTLNSVMDVGDSLTLVFLVTNGATPYYNNVVTIDGGAITPKWQGGVAPTAGNASSVDGYVYSIIKTASATFTVLVSQTQFK